MPAENPLLPTPAPPKSGLARYRLLSPNAAVRVSPLCLGSMNFGDNWKGVIGECDKATTEKILDYYFEQGGNFIDTANNYQWGQAEEWIGEWMKKRGNRDQMVIATKYTTNYVCSPDHPAIMANYTGNSAKALAVSVKDSLKKMQTDYIDLLYVHWWDYSTSIPELMQSLNNLVVSSKVLYLGISDSPAWIVTKANEYARNHGLAQFSVYQGRWSAAYRDFERDIIPMCKAEGMGLAPWGALGQGSFKTEEQRKNIDGRGANATETEINVSKVLESIANRKNTVVTGVALAYVMYKTPYVFPIVGGRKVEHLKGNIDALEIHLSQEDIDEIEKAVPLDIGFPHNFVWGDSVPNDVQKVFMLNSGGHYDYVPESKPIAAPGAGK